MSTRIDASDDEVLEPAHLLMVVVTNHSTQLPAAECRECSLPELMLLEAIARRDGRSVSTLVEETSTRAAVDVDALHAFVEDLRKVSAVRPATGGATTPAAPAAPATSPGVAGDPDTRYVLLSPLLFAVTGSGYEEHDAHGDVRVRLDATELVAARTFLDEVPLGKAYARQAKALGELALDRSAFDGLVSRLLDAGFLRPFDPTDLAFRRGATRRKAIQAWETNGRAAVSAAIRAFERAPRRGRARASHAHRHRPPEGPARLHAADGVAHAATGARHDHGVRHGARRRRAAGALRLPTRLDPHRRQGRRVLGGARGLPLLQLPLVG